MEFLKRHVLKKKKKKTRHVLEACCYFITALDNEPLIKQSLVDI